uniref:Uncharacterized protein n=1 Tax=Aegilops tauschii subsp. strangulata TaxID=200361 RepID=A0A453E641_AEGTS
YLLLDNYLVYILEAPAVRIRFLVIVIIHSGDRNDSQGSD